MIPLERQISYITIPEAQRIFDGLRSKSDDTREFASSELTRVYSKYSEQTEQINQVNIFIMDSHSN